MRSRETCTVLAAALALAAAPVRADPPQQVAAAPAAKVEFEICRVPGAGAELSDATLEIPAGSAFQQRAAPAGDPAATNVATPPVTVVTTQAASLPADRYCVSVPVTPAGGADDRALRATVGDMFVPARKPENPLGLDPLDLTYGLLKSKLS